jgi:tRNA A37 methylthiotransferase MiaB
MITEKTKRNVAHRLSSVANVDSFTLKIKILGCVETAEDTRPAT